METGRARMSDSSDVRVEIIRNIDELYNRCIFLANCTRTKSVIYNIITSFTRFFVIVGSLLSSILTIVDVNKNVSVAIGFTVAALKTTIVIFNLDTKAVVMKAGSQSFSKIARDTRNLKSLRSLDNDILNSKLEQFHNEVDDLELKLLRQSNSAPVELPRNGSIA